MRVHYDRDADALHVRFATTKVAGSEEVRPGVVFDFDETGKVVGFEITDASEHLPEGALDNLVIPSPWGA
jgi:uncharacterized protein YuzE